MLQVETSKPIITASNLIYLIAFISFTIMYIYSELTTHLCILKFSLSVASGGGDAGTPPPPEIGTIVVEIWCYLPEVYTFGAESEIQEIFSKKL